MTEAAMFAAVFIAFYAGHHLGDHILQTDWQATEKHGAGWPAARALIGHLVTYHLCVVAALAGLVAIDVPLRLPGLLAALGWSFLTHGILDRRWPVRWILRNTRAPQFAELASGGLNGVYLADQSLHIACIFVASLLAVGVDW